MKKLGHGLADLVRSLGLENGLRLEALRKVWEELMGPQLSARLRPHSLSDGILQITAESPIWLEHASYYQKEILRKVAPFGINGVRFKTGFAGQPERACRKVRIEKQPAPLSAEEAQLVEEALLPLRDEEIREMFRSVFRKAVTRERKIRT